MRYILIAAGILAGLGAYFLIVDSNAYTRGKSEAETIHAQRALVAEETVRTLERQSAADIVAIEEKHRQELANVTRRKDRVIADLRAGNLRLRQLDTRSGGGPQARPGAAGVDGGEKAGLPRQDIEFLVSLASEADAVVMDRQALQAIVRKDREICK